MNKTHSRAYWVQLAEDDWGMYIHAETRNKAKYIFKKTYPFLDPPDIEFWELIQAQRVPSLDKRPFTDYVLYETGRMPVDEYADPDEDKHIKDAFLDFCPCEMCSFAKEKDNNAIP